ncbi:MAG: leucyl aminopeptidase [Pirellulales bacterium]|nr:leucyl aminopeptidase [Pirellulales bacterium]
MQLSVTTQDPLSLAIDALVVPYFADQPWTDSAARLDAANGGLLTKLRESAELTGKLSETTLLHTATGAAARLVLLVGLGERELLHAGRAYQAAAAAAKTLAAKSRPQVAFADVEKLLPDLRPHVVAGAFNGGQGQDLYRQQKKLFPAQSLVFANLAPADLQTGQILGESIWLTRTLINQPADVIYPESFANEAAQQAAHYGLECEIWDQRRLTEERCGALLAVARGSSREPRLVILRYNGGPANQAPVALVGKGVTFDSGGLSLKTPEGMLTMKCDMSGAATVLGAMCAIARLRLPVNVLMLAGLVENMTGPAAYKLGDVLHARNGKTIEIHNTDAEGRLVLADVLDVALERGAAKIVDLATLTGACVVALGNDVAGAMSNHDAWQTTVLAAAKQAGEPVWPLPMFPEYEEQIQGSVADIKNVGDGRWGGAITAAKFLEQFVAGQPWVHLDIAGPAFSEKPKAWLDGGASGLYVRTLVELAQSLAKQP